MKGHDLVFLNLKQKNNLIRQILQKNVITGRHGHIAGPENDFFENGQKVDWR